MSKAYMEVVCSAMLQAWRNDAIDGSVRYTNDHPTKSGINGMIACAMGIPRKDPRIKKMFEEFELFWDPKRSGPISWHCSLGKGPERIILPDDDEFWKKASESEQKFTEYMMDYQTVGGRKFYLMTSKEKEKALKGNNQVKMKRASGGGNIDATVTYREYIVNHRFVLYVLAEEELLCEMKEYLLDPVWEYYLGCKNCIPTEPVFRKIINCSEMEGRAHGLEYIRY